MKKLPVLKKNKLQLKYKIQKKNNYKISKNYNKINKNNNYNSSSNNYRKKTKFLNKFNIRLINTLRKSKSKK